MTSIAMRCRVAFAVIGVLVGLSAFCSFGFALDNWNCAAWGLLSGLFAVVALYVHIKELRDYWRTNVDQLKFYMLTGCFVQLAGVCGFVVYLTLAITQQQGLIIRGNGYYLALVWCFMTWKWGFLLFYYSRIYKRLYEEECSLLLGYGDVE